MNPHLFWLLFFVLLFPFALGLGGILFFSLFSGLDKVEVEQMKQGDNLPNETYEQAMAMRQFRVTRAEFDLEDDKRKLKQCIWLSCLSGLGLIALFFFFH